MLFEDHRYLDIYVLMESGIIGFKKDASTDQTLYRYVPLLY
eukprot:SAG31_NODE_45785_length_257_cov_0.943038_1_plen_40_part_01